MGRDKKAIWSLLAIIGFSILGFGQDPQREKGDNGPNRPKLVVGIVVDQMRWDYLYRFYDRYGQDGFKRMLREGFSVENAYIDYVPTVTGIGHASIYTGSVPSIHGIAGNSFVDGKTKEMVYCTEDSEVRPVGSPSVAAQMSPHRLLTTTLGDELRLATNFRGKVIGVALKDRSAIFSSGRTANGAFWYDVDANKWVTSSWYMEELPDWVRCENDKQLLEKLSKQGWNTLYPLNTYTQSTEDGTPYERPFEGSTSATFPLDTESLMDHQGAEPLLATYLGNELTLSMAMEAIAGEELGMDGDTDMLTISFSSTDWTGHQFGPNSVEVEDAYLRLDKQLAAFFNYLDDTVGEDAYLTFLTADHGAAHNVHFLKDRRIRAGGWDMEKNRKALNQHLLSRFGIGNLVQNLLYYQVHYDEEGIQNHGLDRNLVIAETVTFLGTVEGVQYVVPMESVKKATIPEKLGQRIINGHHRTRSGAVHIIVEPGWYYQTKEPLLGTDHSSWNPYDAHIPLLFMGKGIQHGSTNKGYNMTDIAPTVAALLKVQEPNGNIGEPIQELFE